jgi:hypothetical protein
MGPLSCTTPCNFSASICARSALPALPSFADDAAGKAHAAVAQQRAGVHQAVEPLLLDETAHRQQQRRHRPVPAAAGRGAK